MAYRNYAPNNGFLVSQNGTGDFTTIQDAITAAPVDSTIFINGGTFTENLIINKSIKLICNTNNYRFVSTEVTIIGSITINNISAVTLQNLTLSSASGYAINSTGDGQSILIYNCDIISNNGDIGINSTGVNTNIYNYANFFATYGQLFNVINSGVIWFYSSRELDNISSTASVLRGAIYARESYFLSEIDMTSSSINATFCIFGSEFSSSDQTFLNLVGSGGVCDKCSFYSDTKTTMILNATSGLELIDVVIQSTATNAISGTGTLLLTGVHFLNSSTVQPTIAPYTTLIGTLKTITPISHLYGGTDITSPGIAGNVLTSDGTNWTSASAGASGGGGTITNIAISTAASVNQTYNCTAALTLTLPASPSQSDTIQVICTTASAVVVKANTGQTIKIGSNTSTSAGTSTNTAAGDTLTLRYLSATTTWRAVSSMGNWVLA